MEYPSSTSSSSRPSSPRTRSAATSPSHNAHDGGGSAADDSAAAASAAAAAAALKAADLSAAAAVGSIVHLLQTTFKDVYERTTIDPPPQTTTSSSALPPAPPPKTQQQTASEADSSSQPPPLDVPSVPAPSSKASSPLPPPVVVLAPLPWHVLALSSISTRLSVQHQQADRLLSYLAVAKIVAQENDVKNDHALKRVGLIQNKHLPIMYSTLDLGRVGDKGGAGRAVVGGAGGLASSSEETDADEKKDDGVVVVASASSSSADDEDDSSDFGPFAHNLVSARQLISDNYERYLRVSGSLPMSKYESHTSRKVKLEDVTKEPGYLKQTASLMKRADMTLDKSHGPKGKRYEGGDTSTASETAAAAQQLDSKTNNSSNHHHGATARASTMTEDMLPNVEYRTAYDAPPALDFVPPVSRRSTVVVGGVGQNPHSSMLGTGTAPPEHQRAVVRKEGEQWDLDMHVLEHMKEKQHFLRNPRYDKRAVSNTRILTRPLPTEADLQQQQQQDGGGNSSSSSSSGHDGANVVGHGKPKGDHGYLIAQPSVVEFQDYKVGGTYEQVLYVRNATAVSRNVTVLPSETQFFSFANVEYPSATRGMLAPGMALKITVRFTADSLANYEDFVTVLSEGGAFKVRLWAHRPPPLLSIPRTLEVGACLVGDAKRKTFSCVNNGGGARFRMMLQEDYPIPVSAQGQILTLQMQPFILTPTAFDLKHGEAVTLTVDYSPLELGGHERDFIIICDNCHITKYTLRGSSESVALDVSGVNGVSVKLQSEDPLSLPPRFVDFDSVPIGTVRQREVRIKNDTPLDLAFRWDLRAFPEAQTGGRPKSGQAAVGWGGRPRSRQLSSGGGKRLDPKTNDLREVALHNDDSKGFDIIPRYGVFPAKSETTFTIRFDAGKSGGRPVDASVESVLVVEGVPPSSIPSDEQASLLANLKLKGHGGYLRMQAWFKAMDKDGGGTIDRAELKQSLEEMGLVAHQRAIRELLDTIDKDGDGQITITEFMDGLPESLQQAIDGNIDTTNIGDIQAAIRKEVDCLAFTVRAASEYVRVSYDPLVVSFPGKVTAGVVYTKEVTLKNGSDAPMEYEFGKAVYDARDSTSSVLGSSVPSLDDYIVDVSPPRGVAPPNGTATATVTFSAKPAGVIDLAIPVYVKGADADSQTSCLRLTADVAGPRLRIGCSEIDFGLVAVAQYKDSSVSITNEGDVPLAWSSINVQAPTGAAAVAAAAAAEASGATNESPFCILSFSPGNGVLGPHETTTVSVKCVAGKLPQRFRTTLGFRTTDDTKCHEYDTPYIGVRAEVQSPKVYLDKTELNLGVTYVDVPVVRHVTLKNLSNLDTKYKFERPAGTSPAFNVEFDPPSGFLSSKQVLEVKVTYVAKSPGMIDDVYGCRIFGMTTPLGFSLKTISKGVVVGYERLEDDAPVPKPLCTPDAPQFIGDLDSIPQPQPPPKLHVAGEIALFTRRTIRFVVRNFSAVPAKFKIYPRSYAAAEGSLVGLLSSTMGDSMIGSMTIEREGGGAAGKTAAAAGAVPSMTAGGKKKHAAALDNSHEETKVFQTNNGQHHTRARIEYQEDRKILKTGKGFAIEITPNEGLLVPWGVTVVTVNTYNNMPAVYKDDICCDITGAPNTRLDFRAKVVGCPLSLRKEALGLDMMSNPTLPKMRFGEVSLNNNTMKRTVVVRNAGPIDALLNWSVREAADDSVDNKVVAFTFAFNDDVSSTDKPLDIKLGLYEKPRFESPFEISPVGTLVPMHGEQTFTLKLTDVSASKDLTDFKYWSDMMEALMVADVQWQHKQPSGNDGSATGDAGDASSRSNSAATTTKKKRVVANNDDGGLERETMGAIKLAVSAIAVQPWLYLDKRRHGERNAITANSFKEEPVHQYMKFSINATSLRRYKETKVFDECMKQTFLLRNVKSIPFEFAVTAHGPFKILETKTLALPHPMYNSPGKLAWNVDRGRPFSLPPDECLEVTVAFVPSVTPLSDGSRDDIDESKDMKLDAKGRLKLLYSTGQEQYIDFKGELMRSMVVAQPSDYHFGVIHTEVHKDVVMFVINPTVVEAKWKIVHIPATLPKRPRMILDPHHELNQEHLDFPEVFTFSETEGVQSGPTLPLTSTAACMPDDKNRLTSLPVFEKNPMSLTWKSGQQRDLTWDDKLRATNFVNPRQPRAVTVTFKPKENKRYRSRFRLEVEDGMGFDVVFTGRGTFDEEKKLPLKLL